MAVRKRKGGRPATLTHSPAAKQEAAASTASSGDESPSPSPLKLDGEASLGKIRIRHKRKQSFFLHTFETTPAWLADNRFILNGYRVEFSLKQCLRSIFRVHNETMNVWTHLLGALLFMFLMVYTLHSLSPHGVDRMSSSFKSEIELVQQYQEQFKGFVLSIRSQLPSMEQISESLKIQAGRMHHYLEIGEHALTNAQAQFLVYVHRIDSVVGDMQEAVTRSCPSCSLVSVQNMHRSLSYNVKKVSELLDHATEEYVDLAKDKVSELSKYLSMIDNKVLDLVLPEHLTAKDRLAYLPRTPVAMFILSAILCLSFSTVFHLFYCHSHEASIAFQRLDYAGICFLISGTSAAAIYYLHFCNPFRRNVYSVIAAALPIIAFAMTFMKGLMHPKYSPIRAGVFVVIGFSVAFPLVQFYEETHYWGTFHWLLVSGGLTYIVGAFFYATKIPERLFPGNFDIWFHSHSLFHIFVVAAAFQHYLSLRVMYEWRMLQPCPAI